jgi:hypothetical protein
MSDEKMIPLDENTKRILAIPFLRHAAIVDRKMTQPIRLHVTDSAGNILYEEKFHSDDQGKMNILSTAGDSQHFRPPLCIKLIGHDGKVWEPEANNDQ